MIVYPTWRDSYPEPRKEEPVKPRNIVSSSGIAKLIYDQNGPIPFPKQLDKKILNSNQYKSLEKFNSISSLNLGDKLLKDLSNYIDKLNSQPSKDLFIKDSDFIFVKHADLFQKDPKTTITIGSPINSNFQIYKAIIVDGEVENPILEAVKYADEQLQEVMYNQHHVAIAYSTLTSNLESTLQKIPTSSQEFSKYQALSLLGLTKEQSIDIEYLNIELGQQTSVITVQKITPF